MSLSRKCRCFPSPSSMNFPPMPFAYQLVGYIDKEGSCRHCWERPFAHLHAAGVIRGGRTAPVRLRHVGAVSMMPPRGALGTTYLSPPSPPTSCWRSTRWLAALSCNGGNTRGGQDARPSTCSESSGAGPAFVHAGHGAQKPRFAICNIHTLQH